VRRIHHLALVLSLGALLTAAHAQKLTNPFFAFDNGTGRDMKVPLEEQADVVKRTGYAGLGYTGTQRIPEMLRALESRGLKMFSTYVAVHVDGEKPSYEAGLPEAIRQLKGHGAAIWLTVQGTSPDGEERAIRMVREVADMAAESGVRVVLYPHLGFYVGRIEDALRIRQKADRSNIGISFNLAHFLAVKDEPNLDQRLREAMPYLEMVSINGAEHEGGWDRLILTLDRGSFDVFGFLKKLVALGYKGPIGLQAYQVPGDFEDNLKRSMTAWRKFQERM
jgi:sugar phosphate isomerase/epimerase